MKLTFLKCAVLFTLIILSSLTAQAKEIKSFGKIVSLDKAKKGDYVIKGWLCKKENLHTNLKFYADSIEGETFEHNISNLHTTSVISINNECRFKGYEAVLFKVNINESEAEKLSGRFIYGGIYNNNNFSAALKNSGKFEFESNSDEIVTGKMRAISKQIPKKFSNYLEWTPAHLRKEVGTNKYIPISTYYDNLDTVYKDFNLDKKVFQTCADRPAKWKKFKMKKYDEVISIKSQCVDLEDSLDWFALQSAFYNSQKGWTVLKNPKNGAWSINQALVLFDDLGVKWADNSFIKYDPSVVDSLSGTGPTGTLIVGGLNPYNKSSTFSDYHPDYINSNEKVRLTSNIFLHNPHINASTKYGGENGISFAGGVQNILVYGGMIKNSYVGTYKQGGKAIQCELGCNNLVIHKTKIKKLKFWDFLFGSS